MQKKYHIKKVKVQSLEIQCSGALWHGLGNLDYLQFTWDNKLIMHEICFAGFYITDPCQGSEECVAHVTHSFFCFGEESRYWGKDGERT